MIVVDASAVVEVLLGTAAGALVEQRLFGAGDTLHAPHLLDVEIAHAIRRFAARGEIHSRRGRTALTDLADFPLYRYPHDPLLFSVWDLRNNLSAYDAVYVALAEELAVPLITRDARLAAAPGHRANRAGLKPIGIADRPCVLERCAFSLTK